MMNARLGVALCLFACAAGAAAQPFRLHGRVLDASGAALPGVSVEASGTAGTSEPVITVDGSRATVRVIPTDEELVVAHHTAERIFAEGKE